MRKRERADQFPAQQCISIIAQCDQTDNKDFSKPCASPITESLLLGQNKLSVRGVKSQQLKGYRFSQVKPCQVNYPVSLDIENSLIQTGLGSNDHLQLCTFIRPESLRPISCNDY